MLSRLSTSALRRSAFTASRWGPAPRRRGLLTLAIETSCDDTSVAIVEKEANQAQIHFLENITCDSRQYKGIHPIVALESHQENIAILVNKALTHLPVACEKTHNPRQTVTLSSDEKARRKPDFISATRGPGMRSNLAVGLDSGKALSVAWQIPFVGVHHMHAHLLTPRLVASMRQHDKEIKGMIEYEDYSAPIHPTFPFLSILVSGGHTMLVKSLSLIDHEILATTSDIAIGDAIDKTARMIVPPSIIQQSTSTMYGPLLEQFAFPNGARDYHYHPPITRGEEIAKRESPWGWSLTAPYAATRQLQFSFSSIGSMVDRIISSKEKSGEPMSTEERVDLARETMRTCFEHLASRTVIALEEHRDQNEADAIDTLVISGGVAANKYLMTVLNEFLGARGFGNVRIIAPPPYLCVDNAAMIGWAGIEMFEDNWRTELSARSIRKWSLDARAEDGGLLGPSGWKKIRGPGRRVY
ncbi:hypothetical protein BO70DRAFT_306908 [Aspergillus heteromorphus CBS 117.55]|uniref:N(6)-L-threonylcarbamoyladenine synthase n=1 Tax=Aspergillus heteromorphus CBS 117.55 TaxID=1448321 RepID=A0A317X1A4_9EURO|nr:uncharacterized protein BO70DRAFT_306908 [Aspergillus heteromorphus CBS 117.55]PWY90728.1 hypothetical protein BO70DRAFT_306908 [Aspergillus heteromorphus CBS 117.55]